MNRSFYLLCIGNPARGDDGVALWLQSYLKAHLPNPIATLVDNEWVYQLTPECVYDLENRSLVVFIDADTQPNNPGYELKPIQPARQLPVFNHSLPPQGLLALYEMTFDASAPEAWLLSIGAHQFGFTAQLSEQTLLNAQNAADALMMFLSKRHEVQACPP